MARKRATVLNILWGAFAGVLFTCAGLATLVRLLLPEIGSQRDALAAWISDTVGRPALVGEIDASWSGWVPRISVANLAFLAPDGATELVRFERATINIAPFRSLLAGALKPQSLVVSGVALTLVRDHDGRFSVAGMPAPKSPLIKWLLAQENTSVTQAEVTIIDQRTKQSFVFSDVAVSVASRDGMQSVTGYVELPPRIGRRLEIELSTSGDVLSSTWDGTLNFKLDGLSVGYLAEQLDWQGQPLPAALGAITGWSTWRGAQMAMMRFNMNIADADAAPLLAAHGLIERRRSGWRLQVAELAFPGEPQYSTPARLSAAWHTGNDTLKQLVMHGFEFPLDAASALASGLVTTSPAWRDRLDALQPQAKLGEFSAAWLLEDDADPKYFADVALTDYVSQPGAGIPGISGLQAHLTVKPGAGTVQFSDAKFSLNDSLRLIEPLVISGFEGKLAWHSKAGQLALSTRGLNGTANGTTFEIEGALSDAFGETAHADLTARLAQPDLQRLHHVVPTGVIPARGEAWLRDLFKGGALTRGVFALRGPLASFPFRNAEGIFAADLEVVGALANYASEWPMAEALNGLISLRGPRAAMRVDSATILAARVEKTNIAMADLYARERFVKVDGTTRGPASSALAIVMASPLKNGRAARLASVDIDGELEVMLEMDLALFAGGTRQVLGQVHLAGNRIRARQQNLALDDVMGTVSFTRDDWYGKDMTANFAGVPVGLVLNGGLDDPNYDSEIRLTGTTSAAQFFQGLAQTAPALHDWLNDYRVLPAIDGAVPWKTVLTLPSEKPARTPPRGRLRFESSLDGVTVDLPEPLKKAARDQIPLVIQLEFGAGASHPIRIDYGNIVDAEIHSHRGSDGDLVIDKVEVLLGADEPMFTNAAGFNFRGSVGQLPLDEWSAWLHPARGSARALPALPFAFDIRSDELSVFGYQFDAVRVHGTRQATSWDVAVESTATLGRLDVPHDLDAGLLKLDFERLHLIKTPTAEATTTVENRDPRRVPALDIVAREFTFGTLELGRIEARTSRIKDGLKLERLNFSAENFNLNASGEWLRSAATQTSRFNIDLHSDTFANLLDRFGFSVANIEDGATHISIDATWPGAPEEFTLAGMTGKFELHVSDGRFLDIEPGGGRVFGLLSLQSLPRRLSLDFDDLFRKGFSFDSIAGLFSMERGNAYTNSLVLLGPAARINVSGRTGLAAQDYDQNVVVTPALSSSIPIAGALFGPIGVGAGAVYYLGQKVFKSIPKQIDKFLSREYAVTGAWDSPSVERL